MILKCNLSVKLKSPFSNVTVQNSTYTSLDIILWVKNPVVFHPAFYNKNPVDKKPAHKKTSGTSGLKSRVKTTGSKPTGSK